MAEETTILQHWIFADFLFPFLLVFFIVFALLERTKIFGDGKKQLNGLTALVIGLIFVSAIYPKLVVGKLTMFLSVALVAVFVIMLIWGFIFGDFNEGFKATGWMKWILGIIAGISFFGALIWATGWYENFTKFFSGKGLGQDILSNVILIGIIVVAVVVVMGKNGGAKGK